MWDSQSLVKLIEEKLQDYLFIVVSNREPYIHTLRGNEIVYHVPPSGLTVALDPVMRACGGIWIAHGSGNGDREAVDKANKVMVPPDDPKYTLKRLWLTPEQEERYYSGFSNEALWPLCHIVYTRPVFRELDWKMYKKVNALFADSILEEVKDKKAFVFIQDYHLSLVAKMLKEKSPNIITALFWHIPWPNPEAFRICPWQNEILEGLLANNLLGFHIRHHCNNFLETVSRAMDTFVDQVKSEVHYQGRKSLVSPFPISIDFERISMEAQAKEVNDEIGNLMKRFNLSGEEIIGIGIDRFDYTKGIPDRLRAIEKFLKNNPQYIGKFVFIQVGVSSRESIKAYKAINKEIDKLVEDINWKYSMGHRKPIICLRENFPQLSLLALRRMARFCIVSSLHDGMNLVAKEYVASRFDNEGVLILSRFTGAARELTDAVLINPYATDDFAEAIKFTLKMPLSEQKERMEKMRKVIQENNIYKWAADSITELVKFQFGA
ncbi:MAG: trehalose-6-phosphate synthase [Dehalococcoidales bacterium]|nr:trehalose-6-phosphate synthase [Dehalococcoidales bacterium]